MTNKIKNTHLFEKLAAVLLVLLSLLSCGGAEKSVKNGRIKIDESITLSQAFDNYQYFNKTKWESFKDSQGRKIVQVTGEIDMNDMFTVESNGMSINMLQGQYFEEILLDFLLNQTIINQNQGKDIISEGDVQAILAVLGDHQTLRNISISEIINNYDSDPQKYQKMASDFIIKHLNKSRSSELANMAESYLKEVYGDTDDWSDDLILERIRYDYKSKNDKLKSLVPSELYDYARIENEHPSVIHLKDAHMSFLELYSKGKSDKGFEAYDKIAGYLKTNLKKNKGSYTCQFAVEENGFRYFAGELSLTIAVDGVNEPVTFNLPESIETLPYLIAVYGNRKIIE